MSKRESDRRATWMREVEKGIVSIKPELRGKMDWYTLTYLFDQKVSIADAIERMTKERENNDQH